jgi:CNT family concentrative nucleoside transporter
MQERLQSALGALVLLGVAFALCPRDKRAHVRARTVGYGVALLLGLGVLVLKTPLRALFAWANAAVDQMLEFSKQGAAFVFGPLVSDTKTFGFVFAFQILPTIVFFAAFMAILYHLGVMPLLVRGLGRAVARTLGTSGAESFSTVADIFVGQTEAPLVIRPYVATLTQSELMACMTAGFATTAGGVLAAYVLMLRTYVPAIAGHLIACSVMSAPASLVIAKLMLPETETPRTLGSTPREPERESSGLLDAVSAGTLDGLRLAANVGAMLISFLALTALVNFCLGWVGDHVLHVPLSLERILGFVFAPLAWLMGVPAADVTKVASLLGQKTVLNEFVAYSTMAQQLATDPAWLSARGRLIASYALCGFANFGSIGIQIGGYGGLAPERRADLARLGPRAMFAGLLTTCLVACVAGVFL